MSGMSWGSEGKGRDRARVLGCEKRRWYLLINTSESNKTLLIWMPDMNSNSASKKHCIRYDASCMIHAQSTGKHITSMQVILQSKGLIAVRVAIGQLQGT